MRNRLGSIIRSSIPYVKEFRDVAGSTTGAIVFQQLEYWFDRYPDGFYKFLEPCPNSEAYNEGDSWTEELGFSKDEFRSAFDRIGIRYTSKGQFDEAGDKFSRPDGETALYCSYHDKIKGLTFYFRNHSAVDGILDGILSARPRELKKPISVNRKIQSTQIGKVDSHIHVLAETTTETTTSSSARSKQDDDAMIKRMFDFRIQTLGSTSKMVEEREACARLLKEFPCETFERFVACFEDAISELKPPDGPKTTKRWRDMHLGWRTVAGYFGQWCKLKPASSSNDWRGVISERMNHLRTPDMSESEVIAATQLLDILETQQADYKAFLKTIERLGWPASILSLCEIEGAKSSQAVTR